MIGAFKTYRAWTVQKRSCDDDYQTSVFPNITIRYCGRLEASLRGIEYTAFVGDGWNAGGTLSYDFGREEAPDESDFMISEEASTDLIGLGVIAATICRAVSCPTLHPCSKNNCCV